MMHVQESLPFKPSAVFIKLNPSNTEGTQNKTKQKKTFVHWVCIPLASGVFPLIFLSFVRVATTPFTTYINFCDVNLVDYGNGEIYTCTGITPDTVTSKALISWDIFLLHTRRRTEQSTETGRPDDHHRNSTNLKFAQFTAYNSLFFPESNFKMFQKI